MSSSDVKLPPPKEVLAGLAVQFVLTIVICLNCLVLFEHLRKKYPWIYSPKYYRDKPIAFMKQTSKMKLKKE
jgi:hypothetical protein